jgi:hypothetical protein
MSGTGCILVTHHRAGCFWRLLVIVGSRDSKAAGARSNGLRRGCRRTGGQHAEAMGCAPECHRDARGLDAARSPCVIWSMGVSQLVRIHRQGSVLTPLQLT